MNKIFEEGRKLYPINTACDVRLDGIYKIENWDKVFYNIKKGKMKERFIQQMKKSEYSEFFRGLDYEFGLNNVKKDLKQAFKIYKTAADNSTDSMAMFRMYHIYKKDYKKFGINIRERILEKFYLFKCFCFLRYPIMERYQNLFNRFDIKLEVLIHFEEEDPDYEIFANFIEHLKKNYKIYNINKDDVDFIENIINIKIILFDDFDINDEITKLYDLINKGYLEAHYKFICLNKLLIDEYKEEEFKILYDKKYYRSYVDYALFLNKKNKFKEALKILDEAKNNGIISAGFIYYDIYLDNFEFDLLMKNSSNFSPKCELYNLLMILIDDINIDSIYSFFEYFFFLKICFKHYNLEYMINVYFLEYSNEIVDFLLNMTKEGNTFEGQKLIEKYYCDDDNLKEFNLACGVIHYYGLKNILKRDLNKALYHIKIAYKTSKNDSYKRFCYYYIFKINNIFNKEKILKKQDKNKKKITPNDSLLLVSDKEIQTIKNKIFNDYYKSLEENIEGLSSSYFYYLSRLYHKKIGNEGDKIMEYLCLQKAFDYKNKNPGAGSIISFYRKYKAKNILEKNKEEYDHILSNTKYKNDSEGYGEKGDICPICMDKQRNTISLPCKHLFCSECINKVDKCPICRKIIMVRNKI